MRSYSLLGGLAFALLAMSVVTVFGAYPPTPGITPSPIVVPYFAPALSGTTVGGAFTVTFPNGKPASITETSVTLLVCGSVGGCVDVLATLTPAGAGHYTYSFTQPSVSGTVTITLPAGSFVDNYGPWRLPATNLLIGTYTT